MTVEELMSQYHRVEIPSQHWAIDGEDEPLMCWIHENVRSQYVFWDRAFWFEDPVEAALVKLFWEY